MSKKRYEHTLRVTKLVVELAKVINKKLVDSVYIAAMYHDVAKEFTDQQVLSLVGKYDHQRFPTVHTLHGVASAQYVKRFFNIQNKSILNAIANHVVPNKNPSMLDMILYCADKLEPGRSKDDVSDINGYISLAKHNLKSAFAKLYKETNAHYN
jgi:nicotinate-nucleotide adenylyltransferase